ncbi:MAG: efflux RND transporter periplasmic adaptor subunit [Woeseiaceae bacterium]|nr:efflux RND transporter periplasmic adaptor subunit [Woeseiaceae bacterium]
MPTAIPKVVLAAAAACLVSACSEAPSSSPSGPATPRAVPVIAEPVRFEHAGTHIEAVGTSRALLSAEIHPAAAGEVVAVNFEPGQFVRSGDVLVELDSRQQVLDEELARLRLVDAERLYGRYAKSADTGAVLPTTLDAAQTAVETARVELEQARITLADRQVRAVFDGFVGGTDVDIGDRIGPDTTITTLDDRSSLLVSVEIPEAYIGELAGGETIELQTWSAATPAVTGEVVDIGSRIDPRNRTFVARARVDNSDDRLRPGMSFRVSIDVQGPRYAVVTETAVLWGSDGAYVWRIVDGLAVRAPVKVIQRREGRVLIDGDFTENDVIVVEGTQRMRDGVLTDYDSARLVDGGGSPSPISGGGDRFSDSD